MFRSNPKYIFLPVMVLASALTQGGKLLASDNCKNVVITISNQTADEVKVKKFEYRDFDKADWKTENMFGVDGFQKLMTGRHYSWTRDLESVLNDKTKFRVTYVHHIGGSKWGSDLTETTNEFTCKGDLEETVTLTK
jgi:hypothetical protein